MSEAPGAPGSRSGFIAVVGRPNTGKSTLVNALVGEKISIVTSKPQTTRHSVLGILNRDGNQAAFVDTPGLHSRRGKLINQVMNRAATGSMAGADLAMLVVAATGWTPADNYALERLLESRIRGVLAVNKIDLIKPRDALLPVLEEFSAKANFAAVVPVSARRGTNLDQLIEVIFEQLPVGPLLFAENQRTDRSDEFRIGEILREKLMMGLHREVPYGLAVEVARLERRKDVILVEAIIWVERNSHKGIVVGKAGSRLKEVGRAARLELETLFGKRFHIETHAKVKRNWADSAQALRQLGYEFDG